VSNSVRLFATSSDDVDLVNFKARSSDARPRWNEVTGRASRLLLQDERRVKNQLRDLMKETMTGTRVGETR